MTVSSDWDAVAQLYAETSENITGYFADIALTRLKLDIPYVRYLDLATGPGTLGLRVAQHLFKSPWIQECRLFLSDESSDMLQQCVEKIQSSDTLSHLYAEGILELVKMDAQSLPMEQESINRLSCMFGLQFMKDYRKVLGDIYRLLPIDGIAVIGVWSHIPFMDLLKRYALTHGTLSYGDVQILTEWMNVLSNKETLTLELKNAGFKEVHVEAHSLKMELDLNKELEIMVKVWLKHPFIRPLIHTPSASFGETLRSMRAFFSQPHAEMPRLDQELHYSIHCLLAVVVA
jgi:ubiquinone/menaquinone biosynthesis C-methylase UbiE